jgi:hypothetical protein
MSNTFKAELIGWYVTWFRKHRISYKQLSKTPRLLFDDSNFTERKKNDFLLHFTTFSQQEIEDLLRRPEMPFEPFVQRLMDQQLPLYTLLNIMTTYEHKSSTTGHLRMNLHASKTVFGHSIWTAMHLHDWIYEEKNPLFTDPSLDSRELIYAGFFHDIAKISSCVLTCNQQSCFRDIYSPLNNDMKPHSYHPVVSGHILLGKVPLWLTCPSAWEWRSRAGRSPHAQWMWLKEWKNENRDKEWYLTDAFFRALGLNRQVLALIAYMHWDIGTLNRQLTQVTGMDFRPYRHYLNKFIKISKRIGIAPSLVNLKKCILVAFADIKGGSMPKSICLFNKRTHPLFHLACTFFPACAFEINYIRHNPWTFYRMNFNYKIIYSTLMHQARAFPCLQA